MSDESISKERRTGITVRGSSNIQPDLLRHFSDARHLITESSKLAKLAMSTEDNIQKTPKHTRNSSGHRPSSSILSSRASKSFENRTNDLSQRSNTHLGSLCPRASSLSLVSLGSKSTRSRDRVPYCLPREPRSSLNSRTTVPHHRCADDDYTQSTLKEIRRRTDRSRLERDIVSGSSRVEERKSASRTTKSTANDTKNRTTGFRGRRTPTTIYSTQSLRAENLFAPRLIAVNLLSLQVSQGSPFFAVTYDLTR